MSMSQSGPSFGSDVYYRYVERRVKGKTKLIKERVRISEKIGDYYSTQRVRDGYVSSIKDKSQWTLEQNKS